MFIDEVVDLREDLNCIFRSMGFCETGIYGGGLCFL